MGGVPTAFAARMQQQQQQIQRIQAKLKGRAQMLEGQAAEIEELTQVMRAKINDDSTAARWGRDGEVERQLSDMEHRVEHQCRVQAHQREMADATVQEVLNLVGTVQAAEPPAGWKAVKLRSTTR